MTINDMLVPNLTTIRTKVWMDSSSVYGLKTFSLQVLGASTLLALTVTKPVVILAPLLAVSVWKTMISRSIYRAIHVTQLLAMTLIRVVYVREFVNRVVLINVIYVTIYFVKFVMVTTRDNVRIVVSTL